MIRNLLYATLCLSLALPAKADLYYVEGFVGTGVSTGAGVHPGGPRPVSGTLDITEGRITAVSLDVPGYPHFGRVETSGTFMVISTGPIGYDIVTNIVHTVGFYDRGPIATLYEMQYGHGSLGGLTHPDNHVIAYGTSIDIWCATPICQYHVPAPIIGAGLPGLFILTLLGLALITKSWSRRNERPR
jgi:hypothetical protein